MAHYSALPEVKIVQLPMIEIVGQYIWRVVALDVGA
jgi:hypothetical protein